MEAVDLPGAEGPRGAQEVRQPDEGAAREVGLPLGAVGPGERAEARLRSGPGNAVGGATAAPDETSGPDGAEEAQGPKRRPQALPKALQSEEQPTVE